jgi:Uma2 family endonuclease
MPATRQKPPAPLEIDDSWNGSLMTASEFDRGDFNPDWRYELINGVLIVTPIPLRNESDPNEELGYWLRMYRDSHPKGKVLDSTLAEQYVHVGENRRRADRLLWIGLGRLPEDDELPTIVVEFVSKRRRDRLRDYVAKRDEYLDLGIKEYWVIDRFDRTVTVFSRPQSRPRRQVVGERDSYRTPLLPGFKLSVGQLLAIADRWNASGKGAAE